MLDLPLLGADPALGRLLEAHAEELLKRVPTPESLPLLDQLGRTIAKQLPARTVGLQAVARDVALSPRTLRRRLTELGAKYQELVDEMRRTRACQLLTDTDASVAEVAEQLGFGTASSFQRAFARWMGCPPSHYRTQALSARSES